MTHFTPEQVQRLRRVIPLPIMMYERIGLVKDDRFVEKMEWMAYAPRSIGGCLTDKQFKTCLSGLYACGDAIPWSGAEGGAAALPGAATSGSSAGRYAAEFAREVGRVEVDELQVQHVIEQNSQLMEREDGIEHDHVLLAVQETIMPYEVLLLREEGRMQNALTKIEDIRDNLAPYLFASDPHYLRMALEAKNLVTCAEMQLRSAIYRKESRGGFCIREDYPFTDNVNWLKWVSAKKDSEGMKIFAQDIPIDRYPVKPSRNRVIDPLWQQAKDLGIVTVEEERIIWE
jgi:succinate dehydrogenase/fumarate reductase flavoprotein subunit